jgi:hypothetical protein
MDHDEALPLVSEIFDGKNVPAEAAQHIQDCPICRERLRDYEEMRIELRLSDSAGEADFAEPPLTVASQTRLPGWAQQWRARVSIPKPALALGLALIVALSVGLGYVRAQGPRQIFHFVVNSPQAEGSSWGAELRAGGKAIYGMPGPTGYVFALFQLLEIRDGVAHLTVRARRFDKSTPELEEEQIRSLNEASAREYQYTPGETLEIPVNDWGTLFLKGELLDHAEKFSWENPSIEPFPNQLVLNAPVLLKGNEIVFQDAKYDGSATGTNPTVSLYVPGYGRFLFRLQQFTGAVAGTADFAHVSFDLDGEKYLLACATPVTGGPQPRQVWVYLDRKGTASGSD